MALRARTEAIARHLTDFLKQTDRFAKTIVFCVDQEHADEMRRALNNLNADLVRQYPDYVCRVTADEGDIGRGHLSTFPGRGDARRPVILTTSQLLTTGVDVPTCKNIVHRPGGQLDDRVQADHRPRHARARRLRQALLQHPRLHRQRHRACLPTPSSTATRRSITEETIDDEGHTVAGTEEVVQPEEPSRTGRRDDRSSPTLAGDERRPAARKYYVDGGHVEIVAHLVYELDPDGKQLRVVKFTDYTAEKVRTLYRQRGRTAATVGRPGAAAQIIWRSWPSAASTSRSWSSDASKPDADPFDLLCHVAFNAPLRTRRERADRAAPRGAGLSSSSTAPRPGRSWTSCWRSTPSTARRSSPSPTCSRCRRISRHGNVIEIAGLFGGAATAARRGRPACRRLLYAA